jgi:SAM-dependent methyltransferase
MSLVRRIIKKRLDKSGYELRHIAKRETLPDYALREIWAIEESTNSSTTRSDVFRELRKLGLGDFGLLMLSMPNPAFPKLSSLLPRMAAKEVQLSWTGDHGVALLILTTDFVRSLAYNFTRATGRSLENARILDFGCGYGRITRLMYYFSNEDQVYAVDPWDKSIETCRADGLMKNFSISDYLPSTLPVPSTDFDLIFAFSVFTHLSEKATISCLNTLAGYIAPNGLIAITIRPVEYWDVDPNAIRAGVTAQQKEKHRQQGFSFLPHDRAPIDGNITYGDSSISLEWLRNSFPNLRIVGLDRSLADPNQIYVFLRKQ